MKEINSIIKKFLEHQHKSENLFLATVVNVQGSTYRQPGAKMLITESGDVVGTISGGCLENDVIEHTRLMTDEKVKVITYDTNAEEDIIWGFGLGCNGIVDILVESLEPNNLVNPLTFISQCFENQQQGIIATVFKIAGDVNVELGSRLTIDAQEKLNSNIASENLQQAIIKDTQETLKNQHSSFHKYQFSSGEVQVFLEFVQPQINLMIFGAGRDAIPLVEFAKSLGWKVTVFDCRALEVSQERFIIADEVILTRRDILSQQVTINNNSLAVVMTHNYFDDLEILKLLIPANIKYLGCLGSKQRIMKLLQDVKSAIGEFNPKNLSHLYAPVGLDIGADTPETIALSIIAEIQSVLKNRTGGFLKNRTKPINQKNEIKELRIKN
ncbi:MAG: XdhC/CoxI family protein [Nostocales cyanobacterium]|nr:MAG: XdhC/CoxI family protein [Nostocales cyanobacterium]TAF19031.1 MAG: XdhC/CoxI family protein [Nostocales cyanobacterium]